MKIDKFTLIIIISILIIGGIVFYLARVIFQSRAPSAPKPKSLSPYILYLTTPVFTFSGKVESTAGNDIIVSQEVESTLLIGVTASPSATGKVNISYRVRTDNETQLSQSPIFIPFLYKDITAPSPRATSIQDLKTGDSLTVYSKIDLRTIQDNVIDAIQITKTLASNSVSGIVTSVSANIIQVKSEHQGPPTTTTPPPPTTYTVNIRQETEMVNLDPADTRKISVNELKIGNQVVIYSATEIDPNNPVVTAEKIDVISLIPGPNPQVPVSVTTPLL